MLFDDDGDYYKPIKVGIFWNNNYIEYEIDDNKNKNLSVKRKNLKKIKPYLEIL